MNDISQNNGALRFASVGWWWDGSTKEQQHLPLQRQLSWAFKSSESYPDLCLCSPHPEGNQFSFFLYVPGTFQVAAPASLEKKWDYTLASQEESLGLQQSSVSVWYNPCWFYSQLLWELLFLVLVPLYRAGIPHSEGVTLKSKYSTHFLITTLYICPLPSYQSCGGFFFFNILSYRTSV